MLSFLRKSAQLPGPRALRVLQRCFAEAKDDTLLKICTILKSPHYLLNEEIPKGITVRLVDAETNEFLGLHIIDAAMFPK
jgi:hypothetical protein